MEYLPMGNLQQYLNAQPNGHLPPMCVRSILNQALQALQYLHISGITHRDIKPENILVANQDPLVKLADFGLSSLLPRPQTFCGTWSYLAPEVYKSRGQEGKGYSNKIDIWALGVVAYNLLGGLSRSRTRTQSGWYRYIWSSVEVQKQPAFLLLKTMLVEDPLQRPTASKCLQDPWLQSRDEKSAGQRSKKRLHPFSPAGSPGRLAQRLGPSTVPGCVTYSASSSSTEILLEEFHPGRTSDHPARQNCRPTPPGPASHFWTTHDSPVAKLQQDLDRKQTGAPSSPRTHHRTSPVRKSLFGEIR